MKPFSLNHLTDTQFEEFCFDLLGELGFVNIKWRKGTGLATSPSDRGRDIVCQLECEDVDGHKYMETWFVECKHSIKGVPPDKIQGILAWATAERPDKALIIASNFLSNPTHDYLENYEKNNKPPFKIRKWERPDLEKQTVTKSKLLRKYSIGDDFPFLSIMHPAHVLYIKNTPLNTLEYLFTILDRLEPEKRDDIMSWAYPFIIRPRYRKPVTGKESRKELEIDEVSYEAFKNKCRELIDMMEERLLTLSIITLTLQSMLHIADVTSIDESRDRYTFMIEYYENAENRKGKDEEDLNQFISWLKGQRQNTDNRIQENHSLYEYFCEDVIEELLLEDIRHGQAHGAA